jgi:hypothetical protein
MQYRLLCVGLVAADVLSLHHLDHILCNMLFELYALKRRLLLCLRLLCVSLITADLLSLYHLDRNLCSLLYEL